MADLLDRPVLAAEVQRTLLEQAGGNPLYAEQFAQLYLEQGSAEELPLPETLQGIIAARLDGLSAEEKDAAAGRGCRSARSSGRDRSAQTGETPRPYCIRWSGRASSAASAARPWTERRSSPSPTRSFVTSPTARSRAASGPRSTGRVAEWIESTRPA